MSALAIFKRGLDPRGAEVPDRWMRGRERMASRVTSSVGTESGACDPTRRRRENGVVGVDMQEVYSPFL